ncbi:MAG TPA: hypothetical protein VHB45_14365 [Alloacidobacterium sp.]|nr:hypothetical protein [Alloacidobacterium sp.]
MNILSLVKAAKGGMSADELLEMLSSLGINMTITPLNSQSEKAEEFVSLANASIRPQSKVIKLSATLKDGEPLLAIMVLP